MAHVEAARDRFFGRSVRRVEAGGFSFGQWVARTRGDEVTPHGHADAHFIFVAAGDFITEAEGGRCAAFSAPLLIFNPATTYHADHFVGAGAFFSITLPPQAEATARALGVPTAPTRVGAATAFAAVWRLMQASDDGHDSALRAESLCFELLSATVSDVMKERRPPAWLARACDLLSDPRCDLSVAGIAAEIGVHPIHLARTFRVFCGCTPGEYLRAHRAHRAAGLLAKTSAPTAEIAALCGFADQSHLIRGFRQMYRVSPEQFRQSLS